MSIFYQAEDGIRDWSVTGVQTCALPLWAHFHGSGGALICGFPGHLSGVCANQTPHWGVPSGRRSGPLRGGGAEIGRASCRDRAEATVVEAVENKKEPRRRDATRHNTKSE